MTRESLGRRWFELLELEAVQVSVDLFPRGIACAKGVSGCVHLCRRSAERMEWAHGSEQS